MTTINDLDNWRKPAKPENADPLPISLYQNPYNIHRRAKFILLSSVFKHHPKFLEKSIEYRFELLKKIERACYNYTIYKAQELNIPTKWSNEEFINIYTLICAKIASNIDQNNSVRNTYLATAIMDGSIDIQNLPKMTSQELYPDKYRSVLQQLELSKNVARTVRTTAMYTCRRCKKSECTYENLYNRSLDEGVNLIITCMSCGLEWKA
jgi:transcription elongation factor S-II